MTDEATMEARLMEPEKIYYSKLGKENQAKKDEIDALVGEGKAILVGPDMEVVIFPQE